MAAGQGTRMRSALPKVAHPVCGRPMVAWSVLAAREAGAGRVCAIVSPDRDISPYLPEGTETVEQPVANGTGGALLAALPALEGDGTVVVLSGDQPLVSAEEIAGLLAAHQEAGAAATLMTATLDEPAAYGRVVRDEGGAVERVVEARNPGDASEAELAIDEVNAGTYAFEVAPLAEALGRLSTDNSQGELLLPDVLPLLREAGHTVAAFETGAVAIGVNDRRELALVEGQARAMVLDRLMTSGVTVVDPSATWIEADVEIAAEVRIEPGCQLRGRTRIGTGSVVGPHSTLVDAEVGERSEVISSHLVDCSVGDEVSVGPFAHLRPGTVLGDGSKAGSFVEIKNSQVGGGAKVPHLSYVGDAEVGEGSNLGASTITANYDGHEKHRTRIGRNVRTGVDTTLVAPVEVGEGAYTGAGSVITEDVPEGALGIERSRQENVEGYARRKEAEEDEGK